MNMNKLICPLCGNDISEHSKEVRTVWMGFYVCTAHDDGTLEKQMMALASKADGNKNFLPNILKSQYSFFMTKQK